jgi:hypothetical protein
MRTLAYVAAVALVACTDSGSTALSQDAHFVALIPPYTSPDECLEEPFPNSCRRSLSLCTDGRAGQLQGHVTVTGTYAMFDAVAHVDFGSAGTLMFDVEAHTDLDDPDVPSIQTYAG